MIRMHVRLIQHKFLETNLFYKRKKIRLFTVKIASKYLDPIQMIHILNVVA